MRLNALYALSLLLIGLAPAIALTADPIDCSVFLKSSSNTYSFVEVYRRSHIFPVSHGTKTEEFGYRIQGSLGQSTSSVYLAADPHSDALVVIKRSTRRPSVGLVSLWRELAVTEYLLENGEEVPRILKTSIAENGATVIAKEYFEGLTGQELKVERGYSFSSLPKELSEDAWNSLEPERERLKTLFVHGAGDRPAFKSWYDANLLRLARQYPEIWSTIERLSLSDPNLKSRIDTNIYTQDFGIQNFLYDVRRKRWLAFDP